MTTQRTRPPTAQEQRVFDRWTKAIENGRRSMEGMIAGASLCGYAEQFRREWTPQLAPVLTAWDAQRVQAILEDWNKIERLKSAVDLQQFSIVLSPSGTDIDVTQHDPQLPPVEGLGIAPLVAVLVIVVVVAAVIAVTEGLDFAAKQQAQLHRTAFAKLSADMAKQPEPIRKAWQQMLDSQPVKQEKGLLEKIFGSDFSAALPLIGLGIALYLFWPMLSEARRDAKRQAEPEPNPCGGDPRTPDQWRVNWSRDPRKAERQLEYITDDPRTFKNLKGWKGWFTQGAPEGFDDEVPF